MSVRVRPGVPVMESNAAGMVLRLALKTRFSEMGWGSTPLLSAKFLYLYETMRSRVSSSAAHRGNPT